MGFYTITSKKGMSGRLSVPEPARLTDQLIGDTSVRGVDVHSVGIAETGVVGDRHGGCAWGLSFDLTKVVVQLNEGLLDGVAITLVLVVGSGCRLHVRNSGEIILI